MTRNHTIQINNQSVSYNSLKIYRYQKTIVTSLVLNTHARDQNRTVQRDKTLLMPLLILIYAILRT